MEQRSRLTVVVPVLADLDALQRLADRLGTCGWPLVVVEGEGDPQGAVAIWCKQQQYCYLSTQASRGGQVALGIRQVQTPWVWVLHADSEPSAAALVSMAELSRQDTPAWGRLNVTIDGLSLIAGLMNLRSRFTQICTGDQGMFFHRELLQQIGGFPEQPLMEDIEVSKRLKRLAKQQFMALAGPVGTSPRRWRQRGVVRTILTMWWFRLSYFVGVSAESLYQRYYSRD